MKEKLLQLEGGRYTKDDFMLDRNEFGTFIICVNCGAHTPKGTRFNHHMGCKPGESAMWAEHYDNAMGIDIIPCCGNDEECFEPGHEQWGHLGETMCKFLQDYGDQIAFICPKINKPIYKNEIY